MIVASATKEISVMAIPGLIPTQTCRWFIGWCVWSAKMCTIVSGVSENVTISMKRLRDLQTAELMKEYRSYAHSSEWISSMHQPWDARRWVEYFVFSAYTFYKRFAHEWRAIHCRCMIAFSCLKLYSGFSCTSYNSLYWERQENL